MQIQQNTQLINKKIAFSNTLYGFALQQAKTKGISFEEYIRYLLVREKDHEYDEPIYMVDEETEKAIAKGMQDLKAGRYTICNTPQEAQAYLENLDNQEL